MNTSNGLPAAARPPQHSAGISPAGVMSHVFTGDYLGGKYGVQMQWSLAAPFLTWAETDTTDATAIHQAGIKTLVYLDPNRVSAGNPFYTTDDSTYAHTCSNYRIYETHDNVTVWVTQPNSTDLENLFASYVTTLKGQAVFDGIFEDEAGPLSEYEVYDPFYPGMPCNYSDSAWINDDIALNQAPSLPVIFNGLSGLSGHNVSLSIGLLAGSNTIAGTYEGCYSVNNDQKEDGWLWQAVENTEIQVHKKYNKQFMCMVKNTNDASQSIDARLYAEASFMLTYWPSKDIYWTYFKTTSGLHVMPESSLVAVSPLITGVTSISQLKTSGGAYAREYGGCYIAGVSVGGCAFVVNSDTTSHPFPFTKYHHTLTISGSGVLDGGTIAATGSAPPSTIAGQEAVIAFP